MGMIPAWSAQTLIQNSMGKERQRSVSSEFSFKTSVDPYNLIELSRAVSHSLENKLCRTVTHCKRHLPFKKSKPKDHEQSESVEAEEIGQTSRVRNTTEPRIWMWLWWVSFFHQQISHIKQLLLTLIALNVLFVRKKSNFSINVSTKKKKKNFHYHSGRSRLTIITLIFMNPINSNYSHLFYVFHNSNVFRIPENHVKALVIT